MSGNNKTFDDKKINKSKFYKSKKVLEIDDIDVDKILVSKNSHMLQISQLNISLDITMMMSLNLYIQSILK